MAGLVAPRACVSVGPPLLARAPRTGSPTAATEHVASVARLLLPLNAAMPAPAHAVPLVAAMIVSSITVPDPALNNPEPFVAVFPVIVVLCRSSDPAAE